jgi:hypothetical protein
VQCRAPDCPKRQSATAAIAVVDEASSLLGGG